MSRHPIELEVQSSSGFIFVTGSWSIGELRFNFEELRRYLDVETYESIEPISDDSICYACRRGIDEYDIDLYEIPFEVNTHDPLVCDHCRDTLINELSSFVEDNVCEVSIQSL